jgi:hypothetical protein
MPSHLLEVRPGILPSRTSERERLDPGVVAARAAAAQMAINAATQSAKDRTSTRAAGE